MATEYEVERDEYKGHALIAFYVKGSRSRYPALSFGAAKAQVVLDIVDDIDLQAELQAFVEESSAASSASSPAVSERRPRKLA